VSGVDVPASREIVRWGGLLCHNIAETFFISSSWN
jgi:hypothetical protein